MVELKLRLYVLGETRKSQAAKLNLSALLERELAGRYELEIVDLAKDPARAEADHVLATPMLLRLAPLPALRIVGDMSMTEKVKLGLGLGPADHIHPPKIP